MLIRTYAGARSVLADTAAFSSSPGTTDEHTGFLVMLDPPVHTRYRRALVRLFTRSRVESLAPRVEFLVDRALDDMTATADPVTDLIPALVGPVPFTVICELLGIPEPARPDVAELAARLTDLRYDDTTVDTAHRALAAYFRTLAATPEATGLLAELAADETLTVEEAAGIGVMVLNAGYETTSGVLGLGLLALLDHPDQLRALAAAIDDPRALRDAVEEILRFHSPIQYGLPRRARTPTTIEGEPVDHDQKLTVSIDAVNRDPTRFTTPETFDIRTPQPPHLAFGHGVHQCVGAALARLELTITLRRLLTRHPTLTLAGTAEDVVPLEDKLLRGLGRLLVRW